MSPPVEYIDVLTPDGRQTGRSLSRDDIHKKGLWHRTVHIWLVTPGHDILLQKRAQSKQTHPGLWDMACAGHISAGESSLDAAQKELAEELGIHLLPDDLTFLFSMKSEFILHDGRYIDREIHDIYLSRQDIPLSRFTIQPEEVEAVRYVPLQEFIGLVEHKDSGLVPHFREFQRITDHLQSFQPMSIVNKSIDKPGASG